MPQCTSPAIDSIFDYHLGDYWSTTSSANTPDEAWLVDFHYGNAFRDLRVNENYARCIRNGLGSLPICTVPGAPTGVTATGGNAQATVSFTPPSTGGSPITSYTVTSSPGGKTATGESSPITVTGLTNGTAYTFTVKATNAVGAGPASIPSNSVTPTGSGTVSGAPTGVTATGGNMQAMVIFSPPSSDGGSPITSYTVTSSPGGNTATGESSPITVTGLTNGTAYTFTVKATNAVGTGPASAVSNSVIPATVPEAPTEVTATAGNTQAAVSFTPPSSNGGSPITSYTVTSSPGGNTATGESSPITVTGLTNGTTYWFTVRATNAVGTGPASAVSNSVIPIFSYGVSGRVVTSGGAGISGVTMTFNRTSGSSLIVVPGTVTTDPNGNWSQLVPQGITLRVAPSKGGGYAFNPSSTTFSAPRSDLNFTGGIRFMNNGDGTVADSKTGLMWQKGDDATARQWDSAGQYCADLVLGGHDDWRLPRIDEIQTIVDYSRAFPPFNPIFDVSLKSNYWSSSTYAGDAASAWDVYNINGGVNLSVKTLNNCVLCVRGGPYWPSDSSTHLQIPTEKPNTVLDTYWGYMWQKSRDETPKSWYWANVYCDNLVLDGYSDWRLPEMEALQTIANYTTYDPALSMIFNGGGSGSNEEEWSSYTYVYAGAERKAWSIAFLKGQSHTPSSDNSYFVRCVRSGP